LASATSGFIAKLGEEVLPATKTAAAVIVWIALDGSIPEIENPALQALVEVAKVALAVCVAHVLAAVLRPRPIFTFDFEWLVDPNHQHGERVEDNPFRVTLSYDRSVWFLVRVSYVEPGQIAKWLRPFLVSCGCDLELDFTPAGGVLCNLEHATGAPVHPLIKGRKGVRISIPSDLAPGAVANFQLELVPDSSPAPLHYATRVSLVGRARKWRHRMVRLDSKLAELRLAVS
jgi:hypothetical protein